MNKKTKIYVAGHGGLVGSAIMRALSANGYTNIITRSFSDLDLRNQIAVSKFFAQEQPEYVFLAAAKVGGIWANNTYKAEFIYDNLMIAANVIHACYTYKIKKLLNLGSSCIYPKNAPQPLKEEYLLTGPLEPTNEPYAIAKIAAIKLCQFYNEQYGTNFISVMPTNLYGPHDNFNLETAHVLPALLRKFYLAKLLEEGNLEAIGRDFAKYKPDCLLADSFPGCHPELDSGSILSFLDRHGVTPSHVMLWGSGKPLREFLYVDDLAQALLFLMENHNARDLGLINIGSGSDISIYDLALLIKKIVGFNGRIIYDPSKPDGVGKKLLDVSRLTGFGWRAQVTLAQGLEKTYNWYCEDLMCNKKGVAGNECSVKL